MLKKIIIMPAYNEQDAIMATAIETTKSCPDFDILIINDCSQDNTIEEIKKTSCKYLNLPINLGIGGAVQTGLIYAYQNGYDIAVQVDGDGQHPPKFVHELIQPIIDDEADFVIGSRFITEDGFQSSGARRIGIKILSILIRIVCSQKVLDVTSGFRAANRKAIQVLMKDYSQDYPEPDAIITLKRNKMRIKEIPVAMEERQGGISSINGLRNIYYMVKVSTSIIISRFKKEV